tara:strand:- start:17446 stop:17613 length:168 start_codon:yes stop_codon:yes gene_type:complete
LIGRNSALNDAADFSVILNKHQADDQQGAGKGERKKSGDSDSEHDTTSFVLSMSA